MHKFVGTISYQITQAAIEALQTGDAKKNWYADETTTGRF
jgi:hypothetical protein